MALRSLLRPSSVALRLMAHTDWFLIPGGKSTAMPSLSAGGAGEGKDREGGGGSEGSPWESGDQKRPPDVDPP